MEPPKIYTWDEHRPGRVIYTSSVPQRGQAAHIRQWDDNRHRSLLTKEERKFVNKVIHDISMDHEPGFDEGLEQLHHKYFGDRIEAEGAAYADTTDASIELPPDRLEAGNKPVVLPLGKPLTLVTAESESGGAMLDVLTIGPLDVQLCLADDEMVRVQSAANKDQYLGMIFSEDQYCFGALENALTFEMIIAPTGRVIYEAKSTGQALQIVHADQEKLIIDRRMNAVETQSRLLSGPSEPSPSASSAAQGGQASDVSTGREGSISVNATKTSDGKNKRNKSRIENKKNKNKEKNKKKSKEGVDTQQNTPDSTLVQTCAALQITNSGLNRFDPVADAYKGQILRLKIMVGALLILLLIAWGYFWTSLFWLILAEILFWNISKGNGLFVVTPYLWSLVVGPGVAEVREYQW